MPHVRLDAAARERALRRAGVELNFGAIGKGFALDRMGVLLRARGARARAAVGRTQQRARARRASGRGWPVDLRPRLASRRVGRLWIKNGAVGTSGAGEQFVEVDGQRYGHVIDPRDGPPGGRRARRQRDHRRRRDRRRAVDGVPHRRAGRWRGGYCAAHAETSWRCSSSTNPANGRKCSAAAAARHWRCWPDAGTAVQHLVSPRRVASRPRTHSAQHLARVRRVTRVRRHARCAGGVAAGAAVRARRRPRRQPLLHPADGRLGRHARRRAERPDAPPLGALRHQRREADLGRRGGRRPARRPRQSRTSWC